MLDHRHIFAFDIRLKVAFCYINLGGICAVSPYAIPVVLRDEHTFT